MSDEIAASQVIVWFKAVSQAVVKFKLDKVPAGNTEIELPMLSWWREYKRVAFSDYSEGIDERAHTTKKKG
jgi:hypothetical protein